MLRKRRNRYFTTISKSNSASFFPMEIGSNAFADPSRYTDDWLPVSTSQLFSNTLAVEDRSDKYQNLLAAIASMSNMPEGHDFHVDPQAAIKAADLLALISENFQVDLPKVMPQDGDSVVFTWDYGAFKRYLTVDAEDVDMMDLSRAQLMRCVYDTSGEPRESFAKLIHALGARPSSSSSAE